MKEKLSLKQKLFIENYEGNGTDAARKAGYKGSESVLGQVAYENLRKPEIQKEIKQKQNKQLEPLIADRTDRQKFWTQIMSDVTVELRDRLKASELLAKAGGDFLPKQFEDKSKLTLADIIMGARAIEKDEQ